RTPTLTRGSNPNASKLSCSCISWCSFLANHEPGSQSGQAESRGKYRARKPPCMSAPLHDLHSQGVGARLTGRGGAAAVVVEDLVDQADHHAGGALQVALAVLDQGVVQVAAGPVVPHGAHVHEA